MPRHFKDWLKAYLKYTSLSESPEIFHFWTGVSTIAGCLKRRVWIDQRYFEWTPNFYIVFVAPPGIAAKSTTIGIGASMLREIDGVNMGPDSGTWQALGKSLMESRELIPKKPGDLMGEMEEMSCITCAVGELGTFLDFEDRKLIDTLTHLWDGQRGTFEHRTVSNGIIHIANPWINILAATTPAWLRANVPEQAIGGGFASRVIFVFGNKKRQLVAYPGLINTEDNLKEMREKLVEDLNDVAGMLGEMILTPEAIAWGENWYSKHWEERPLHMASERFDGYIARKQTHIHKLAMVLSASQSSSRIVTDIHLQMAEKITTSMENDMVNVFESIGVAPTTRLMSEVINFIYTYAKNETPVSEQALYRHAFQIMSDQELSEVLAIAIKAGYLEIRQGRDGLRYYHLKVKPEEIGNGKKETTGKAHW